MFGLLALVVATIALASGGKKGDPGAPGANGEPGGGSAPMQKKCVDKNGKPRPCSGAQYRQFQTDWNGFAATNGWSPISVDGCVGPETCNAANGAMVYGVLQSAAAEILSSCGC